MDGSTTLWKPVLNKNNGAYFSSAKNAVGEFKYIYNGLNDTDIISTKYSIGGTGRSMTTRNDMDILTGEGDDIIAVGQDIGRSYSTGYTDKKYLTDMGMVMISCSSVYPMKMFKSIYVQMVVFALLKRVISPQER